jgi:hypothetical protein
MARYTIVEDGRAFQVHILDYEGPLDALLDAFRSCQEGRCACPTDEYEHLETLTVDTRDREIVLKLLAKEGARFDRAKIANCLDFTLEQAGRDAHLR